MKTSVNTLVTEIQRKADYIVSGGDSDLDTFTIDRINDVLKEMKQLFMDYDLRDEISVEGTITTTADQEYVDISTQLAALDQILIQSERTNDRTIQLIPFTDYRKAFTDPTASSASTPDVAARHFNRIYFGPTPSQALTIIFDYIKFFTDVSAGGTMPFDDKYDPIVINKVAAAIKGDLLKDFQTSDRFELKGEALINRLIVGATRNFGMNREVSSRRSGAGLGPQADVTGQPGFAFGVGGFGALGFGGI